MKAPMKVLPEPEEKRAYVQNMFSGIAGHYDFMNRLMTLGQDQRWRRQVVRLSQIPPRGGLLDVATGTGDIAYQAWQRRPQARVVGLDFAAGMLRVAQEKFAETPLTFVNGDALHLPFPDDSFDAATSAFMMRNVVDVRRAFAEQRRVVRPGGKVVCLETTRPTNPFFRAFFDLYFFYIVPALGGLFSVKSAYNYLPNSTVKFPPAEQVRYIMVSVGLRDVFFRKLMFGTVAIHVGTV